ncbi:hypothetical protein Hden_1167 [Hyphomicrobium denitrificans ATCC 51888]|uniref:Uncharacterized protein n=1 Tax=Hyphomicrobium denitrificans (strain ATCC 51888 / DSM 1869 / NCIMB 11706 / TK 0415) TaxID=582899 RepID=D8JVU1_HYPDA|nr:hypothetical protein [Hyphomicrobium denitrificans]ADJ22980.1 hypothetical protein Hden_1167 [Hyphomicrobium denitrificans ATCC 51888]
MTFIVSKQSGCGKEGCHAGVAMDDDTYFEGYEPDVIYRPCQCHPKCCPTCGGSGEKEVDFGTADCPDCNAGWRGDAEHPDCRYSDPATWREMMAENDAPLPNLETKVRARIQEIRDELNMLAIMGAVPMWGSLIGRLDDMVEELFGASQNKKET